MIYTKELEIKRTRERESLRAEAYARAKLIASFLKEKYGAKKVILFGSIQDKKFLHKGSDIDLLVEGIKDSEILHAGFEAWQMANPFDVDIIPIEKADPTIRAIAEKKGVEL